MEKNGWIFMCKKASKKRRKRKKNGGIYVEKGWQKTRKSGVKRGSLCGKMEAKTGRK